jgi:peptidoglycan/xylan/chitin deacetylase (PgdA/CDA1 family)
MIPQRGSAVGLSGGRYSSPTKVDLKLRRWRKKLRVLLRPNALNMLSRRLAATTAHRLTRSASQVSSGCVILAYHRVTTLNADPQMLAVTPSNFSAQLTALHRHFNVISLTELTRRLIAGESLSGSVTLTFDDGYADNLLEAKPLLERYATPATIFIASNHIDISTEFWWDELERLLLQPGTLPRTLRIRVGDRDYSWDLGDDAHYSETHYENNRTWTVTKTDTVTRRHQLYHALHGLLGLLDIAQRERILDSLRAWAGKERNGRTSHRALTKAEAQVLASGGLIEIGAHTANHPVLSMLSAKAQEAEIRQSKQHLAQVLGKAVTSFAYPYGSLSDYGGDTVKLVKGMDFTCACSTFADVVRPSSDRFQLPRFMVRDWNGEEFTRRMQMWMQR